MFIISSQNWCIRSLFYFNCGSNTQLFRNLKTCSSTEFSGFEKPEPDPKPVGSGLDFNFQIHSGLDRVWIWWKISGLDLDITEIQPVAIPMIKGVKICKRAPPSNHMLFVDDSYLYSKTRESEVQRMVEILEKFELASEQKVNRSKSSLFYSKNTSIKIKHLCKILQMKEADENCKYFELPNMMQRSKVATLGFLKDRVWKKEL